MKKCTICHTEYDLRIEYCFRDGSKLDATNISQSSQSIVHPGAISGDPVDMMQTLDNISIDDLLQIGGPGAFKGFGEFTPIQAPASKDGDTISMSRTTIRDMLEQEAEDNQAVNAVSSSAHPSSVNEDEIPDIEDVLGLFGNDIGAHLDDTLDGVQVGQILDDSTLDMDLSNSNEIMPGDTLDVMVGDLDMPEMSESDLQSSTGSSPDLDAWDASGPIMQEAARQAMAQHKAHTKSTSSDKSGVQGKATQSPSGTQPNVESASEKKSPILFVLAGVLLIGGIGFALLGGEDKPKVDTTSEKSVMTERYTPPPVDIKSEPSEDDNPEEPIEMDNAKDVEDSQSTEKEDSGSLNAVNKDMIPEQPMTKPAPKDNLPQQNTSNPPVQDSKVGSTVSSNPKPIKPNTTPKPMPSKDKETNKVIKNDSSVEIGWGSTDSNGSGGWGDAADDCSVTVRSNVSSAEVYIDGSKRGTVGQTIPVDCGSHRLELRAGSYEPKFLAIEVSNASQHTMDFGR